MTRRDDVLLQKARARWRLDLTLRLSTAAVALVAAASVIYFVIDNRRRTLATAAVTTQNLARLLDENLTAAFDKVDLALLAVQDEADRQAAEGREERAALQRVLTRQRERAPDVVALRILDERGELFASAPPVAQGLNAGDREYFLQLRDGAASVVSKPVVGRLTPRPIVVFGRRLGAPGGPFRGAIIGVIDLNHVAQLMATPDVGRHGVVVLRAEDLRVVARTDTHGAYGILDTSAVSEELRRQVAVGHREATYEALAPSDRTRRILSYRHLDHHPFYIIVGLAHDDQLAAWRREAATALGLLLAYVALLTLVAILATRALRRQRSAEERLATTLQSIGEGVVAIDLQRRVVVMNGVAEALTGWRREEALGHVLEEVYQLVDRRSQAPVASAATAALDAATGAAPPPARTALRARDGALHPVIETGAPIRDRLGVVAGAVLVVRDVTDQERAEEELMRVERLASLAVLAGGIAHDFNNLLTGITGNLSIAKEEAAPGSDAWDALTDAEAAAVRARDLTRQLLTFSHGGAPVKSRVDLSAVVEEVARFAAHGAGTALELHLAPGLTVEVDRGQIGQVVQNLVINAIQAMASKGRLRIETRRAATHGGQDPAAGERAVITVTDSGPGIPPEVLSRIFDPFFTTKAHGTGLGLAICHSIVTRHGGTIEADSRPGEGATFRVTLPASAQPAVDAAAPGHAVLQHLPAGGRILVMDDEAAVRRLAQRALQPLGLEVTGARDGDEALALYQQALATGHPFSAVVIDLTVPGGMGGLETLRRLRAVDPGVVAIVSSGYSNDPVMADAASHGFSAVLAKPYMASDLRETLGRVLLH